MTICSDPNGRVGEIVVEEQGGRRATHRWRELKLPSMSTASSSPAAIRVNRSSPTARTNGSANGSEMADRGRLLAAARAAATIVAVAPTLLAKSQVSSSVRATVAPRDCAGYSTVGRVPANLLSRLPCGYGRSGTGNNRRQHRLRHVEPAQALERHRRIADRRDDDRWMR